MSGRNRGPPPPPHAGLSPPVHDPMFGARGGGAIPPHPHHHHHHPAFLDEFRDSQLGLGPRPLSLHPAAVIEERLAAQHGEIQGLLVDNQMLAATHVALKQEQEVKQHELQQMAHYQESLRADTEGRMRELYDKSVHLEAELRGAEAARAELLKVHADIKVLTAVRQDLSGQVQAMTQDLGRMTADLKQMPALKADVEAMRQELQRAR